ncbi:LysE family transporter [Noviherbaspirillum saxi]|uniref:Chemotaxis protein n=1 Tax=Noviherbaspirillum saxi TaxID=2320863 RepID=A0A3A3G7A0_9BURK|nr:LysE family transporter [Noviherbaspirillum saxi]RJF96070.1 chemotaxis protein [Noviherbaspirillum saxi]
MIGLFLSAFLLGLVFNAAPGAVFAETVRQGVRGGFRPAFEVQVGSLVGDATWAVLGLVGVGMLLQLEALRLPIGLAGAIYLLWLARDAWIAASREFSIVPSPRASSRPALRSGATLSLTNPQNLAFWAAIGSAMGAVGIQQPGYVDYTVFFSGFMMASVLWAFFCAAVIARLFRNASRTWVKLTYKLCAVAFLALALASLRDLTSQTHNDKALEKPAAVRSS